LVSEYVEYVYDSDTESDNTPVLYEDNENNEGNEYNGSEAGSENDVGVD